MLLSTTLYIGEEYEPHRREPTIATGIGVLSERKEQETLQFLVFGSTSIYWSREKQPGRVPSVFTQECCGSCLNFQWWVANGAHYITSFTKDPGMGATEID
jgi:hypothetical protein